MRIGPYEVLRELGRGGMGVVYEVRDPAGLPRRLALKLLRGEAHPDALLRFAREVELLGQVRHPNVVAVHTVGRAPEGPYVVMDLVEGEPLSSWVGRSADPARAVEVVRALCAAVGALHAQGILHRDLKPQNVIVRPDGAPVLLDFGIARSTSAHSLTRTGELLGTPRYMAPEQAEGKGDAPLDARADVYGLGAILFELLAGAPPFAEVGGGPWAVIVAVSKREPRWPGAERGVSPALQAVLRRAMARRADDRPPTAEALSRALEAALAGVAPRPARGRAAPTVVAGALLAAGVLAAALGRGSGAAPTAGEQARPVVAPRAPALTRPAPPAPARATRLGPRWSLEHLLPDDARWVARGHWVGRDRVVTAGGAALRLWDLSGDAPRLVTSREVTPWMGRRAVLLGDRLVCGGRWGVQAFAAADLAPLTPDLAVAGIGDRHVSAITATARWVAFGDDGGGGRVLLCSPTLDPVAHTVEVLERVKGLAFSPAGDRLACATDAGMPGVVRVWRMGPAGPEGPPHEERLLTPVTALAYAPDGDVLVGGTAAGTLVRFTPDGAVTDVLGARGWTSPAEADLPTTADSVKVFDLAFSPDGALLVVLVGDDERSTVRVLDARAWTRLAEERTTRRAQRLALSPDGRRLLVGMNGVVEVWDVPALPVR